MNSLENVRNVDSHSFPHKKLRKNEHFISDKCSAKSRTWENGSNSHFEIRPENRAPSARGFRASK
ncbi:hypothetical protein, partial [Leptolyngbya sp. FACHB-16]|uniref:hypothetical protein n=1 Tax=unclassified Leptolyngbya TaxID=2650499 RepID=UPI001A7E50DD